MRTMLTEKFFKSFSLLHKKETDPHQNVRTIFVNNKMLIYRVVIDQFSHLKEDYVGCEIRVTPEFMNFLSKNIKSNWAWDFTNKLYLDTNHEEEEESHCCLVLIGHKCADDIRMDKLPITIKFFMDCLDRLKEIEKDIIADVKDENSRDILKRLISFNINYKEVSYRFLHNKIHKQRKNWNIAKKQFI